MALKFVTGSFIEVTWKGSNSPMLLSINTIETVSPTKDGNNTKITFDRGKTMTANEPYEDVREAITRGRSTIAYNDSNDDYIDDDEIPI